MSITYSDAFKRQQKRRKKQLSSAKRSKVTYGKRKAGVQYNATPQFRGGYRK